MSPVEPEHAAEGGRPRRFAAFIAEAGRNVYAFFATRSAFFWLTVVAICALVVRIPFLVNGFSTVASPDTAEYVTIAEGFLAGDGFETEMYRTAGYPLFIALISLLPGPTQPAVALIQHLLGVLLAIGVFLVADRYFGRVTAVVAGFLTAVAPPMLLVEHYVMPDLLFAWVVFAGTVMVIEAVNRETVSTRLLVAAGLAFGLAVHLKPAGQVLIVIVPIVLALVTRSWRPTLRGSAVATAAMVLVVLPWVVHNAVKYEDPSVSAQGGQALWLRVFDQDRLPIPTDSAEGALTKGWYDEYFEEQPPQSYPASYSYVLGQLVEEGYSRYEASNLQGDLAMEAIAANPRAYVEGTGRNVRENIRLNRDFRFAEAQVAMHLDDRSSWVPSSLATTMWKFAAKLVELINLLSLALLAVPLLLFSGSRGSRIAAGTLLLVGLVIATGTSLTTYILPRYAVQAGPMQWILTAAAATLVVSALVAWLRRNRSTAST